MLKSLQILTRRTRELLVAIPIPQININSIASSSSPNMEGILLNQAKSVVPKLSNDRHKGAAGRIGVIGGSIEYTGAPYFSAITALKVGADLSHVFCQKAAAPVIKSYSPELIVHPVLDAENSVKLITPWLARLHVLIIGPGLGREINTFKTVRSIINYCAEQPVIMPLVIDADGLFFISEHPDAILGYPGGIILTPNAMEFSRLFQSVLHESIPLNPEPDPINVSRLAGAFGSNVVIVLKGPRDVIATSEEQFVCTAAGSGRRCGGQGDLLCGSLGTFFGWALAAEEKKKSTERGAIPPGVVAAYAACRLTRECNLRAYHKTGRSTLTSDMIHEIHQTFLEIFETQT